MDSNYAVKDLPRYNEKRLTSRTSPAKRYKKSRLITIFPLFMPPKIICCFLNNPWVIPDMHTASDGKINQHFLISCLQLRNAEEPRKGHSMRLQISTRTRENVATLKHFFVWSKRSQSVQFVENIFL